MINEQQKIAARKAECELDYLYQWRYFFKQRFGFKAHINWHHRLLADTMHRVVDGEIKRLIINIPPGYGKTDSVTIGLINYGLSINPQCRFLHLSYSDNLALLNSSTARQIIKSREYQAMWPMALKDDADSKKMWWTEHSGGVYAASTTGQVTGFRAGHMTPDIFSGALLYDDPVKPADAYTVERDKVNERYNDTASSRLAQQDVPIIVIMQRIHWDDLSGYLLQGGSGEKWHHLEIPVEPHNDPYPQEWTHGIPIEYDFESETLWDAKHNKEQVEILKSHRITYASQYKQRPIKASAEGAAWRLDDIDKAHNCVNRGDIVRTVIAIDPSVSNKDGSDEVGIGVASKWAVNQCEDITYSVDSDRSGVMHVSEWAQKAISMYEEFGADAIVAEVNQGGDLVENTLRQYGFTGRYIGVHAKKGKILRAEPVAALYSQGLVKHRANLTELEGEQTTYIPGNPSPNRLDWCVYALTELSNGGNTLFAG